MRGPSFAVLALALCAAVGAAEKLQGRVKAVDGRTVRVGETLYRLKGIDAPEPGQFCFNTQNDAWVPCGSISREALAEFLRGKGVSCAKAGDGADGTPLAECFRDGLSVNRLMVRYGMAMSAPSFEDEQARAKQKSAGLWKTRLVHPSEWRTGTRLRGEPKE
jgi:endonuclease YncB( thermonuclease family)